MMMKTQRLVSIALIATASFVLGSCKDQGLFSSSDDKDSEAFEGKVSYEVDYQLPPERQNMSAMLPDEEVVYLKGGKTRLERVLTMGVEMAVIHNPSKDSLVQLIDPKGMGGEVGPTRVPRLMDTSATNVEYKDETKTVTVKNGDDEEVDYLCKKAVIRDTIRGNGIEMPVWYTDEIEGQPFRQFKDLKGLPLKFKSEANGFTVEKVAKRIVKEEVSDTLFNDSPEGYKTRSMKEFRQMMGGGGR
jgi:hypothetical protein